VNANLPDPATVVGIGLGALIALGGALWKAASLRGDVNRSWSRRVDAATAALTDRAIDELQALRRETDRLLGDPDEASPPVLATVDPTPLVRRAEAVASYADTRDRLDSHLRRLLRVAPLLVPSLVVLIMSVVLLTLYFSDIAHFGGVRIAGLATLGVGGLPAVGLFGIYLHAQHRLSGAELMGESPPDEGEE
jgi:hypothetical protein